MDDTAQNNRFAPPGTFVDDVVAADDVQLATRGRRFVAAFIDGMVALAISVVVMLPLYGSSYFRLMGASKLSVLPGLLAYLAVFYVIQGWFLYKRSQSVGKIAMGLRIVRQDGSAASLGRTLGLRMAVFGAFGLLPVVGPFIGIVDVLFIFSASRRCLHDLLADTIVVTAASSSPPPAR